MKLPNLHMLLKQKIPSFPRNLAFGTFGKLLIVFSAKVNLLYRPEVLSFASDKAKLVANNFSKNSNLYDCGISLLIFPSRTNLKLHNISITPKTVTKVITNLDPRLSTEWHAGLLHKLKSYGISGQIFGLSSPFLSNRQLQVT